MYWLCVDQLFHKTANLYGIHYKFDKYVVVSLTCEDNLGLHRESLGSIHNTLNKKLAAF